MSQNISPPLALANKIAAQFKRIPIVDAVALGGSQTGSIGDIHSDIDVYVYAMEIIPLPTRQKIANTLGTRKADFNLTFWDLGDEWFDAETGIEVDLMYWDPGWIEGQLDRVLTQHLASLGYSTCFWHTVLHSRPLFDRQGWFSALQKKSQQPYPRALKRAIIAKNHPVLRNVIPAYFTQIEKALVRQDLVSLNHRTAALFASYFDVLFALNEKPHPGEKKLVRYAVARCKLIPQDLESQIEKILLAAAIGDANLLLLLGKFLDELDALLVENGFDPAKTRGLNKQS